MSEESKELNNEVTPTQLQLLKQKADVMGVSYPKNANLEKMLALLKAHEDSVEASYEDSGEIVKENYSYNRSTVGKVKDEAFKLCRFQLVVNDPALKSATGATITAGNDTVGHKTRIIPFNVDSWHAEAIILEFMRSQKFTSYGGGGYNKSDSIKQSEHLNARQLNKYTIIDLPPLTEEELKKLADKQARDGTGKSEDGL